MSNLTNKSKSIFLAALFLLAAGFMAIPQNAQSQEVSLGADVVSRYVWRGIDFGNSVSIQPSIEYSGQGFTAGTWASYAISPVENASAGALGASEIDLYLSYDFGPIAIGVTDYYFPNAGKKFFNFDDNGAGAHIIEPNISISGGEAFPLQLFGAINAYNDPDNSVYLEASLPFSAAGTDMVLTAGGVPMESAYYGTNEPGIINLGLSVSKSLVITDTFSLPLSGSFIVNPYDAQAHLVFGLSL